MLGRWKEKPLSVGCPLPLAPSPLARAVTPDRSSSASVPLRTDLKCMCLSPCVVSLFAPSNHSGTSQAPSAHSRARDFGQILFRAPGYEKGGPEAAFRKAVLYFCRST